MTIPGHGSLTPLCGDFARVSGPALLLIAILALGLGSADLRAQDCPEIVGRWPYGSLADVAVVGEIGYIITGSVFQTLDLSDPTAPVVIGEFEMPWAGGRVVVRGSLAYLVNGDILVIDVSDPATPFEAGSLETEWLLRDPVIAGDRMVTEARPGNGYCVIDLLYPTAPTVIHRFEIADLFTLGFSATEHHVYVAVAEMNLSDGVRIFDIGQLPEVVEIHFEPIPDLLGVSISGSTLFAATYGFGNFRVMDVSDPTDPVLLGYTNFDPFGPWISKMVPSSGRVVAIHDSGLLVIDVIDPTDPFLAGEVGTQPGSSALAVAGDTALIGGPNVEVVDLSVPSSPDIVGSYEIFGYSVESAVKGDHAFTATGSGLRVFDVSVPEAPVSVGRLDGSGPAVALATQSDLVFVAEAFEGFRIVDVSVPTIPATLGILPLDLSNSYVRIGLIDDIAYVSGEFGINVIDIQDLSQPILFGVVGGVDPNDLVSDGSFVYTANGPDGLEIYEPVDSQPGLSLVATLPTDGSAAGLAVKGNVVYLVDGDLRVIDVTEPTNPVEIAMVEMPDGAESVTIIGRRAYVRDWYNRLQVVGIDDPPNPTVVGLVEAFNSAFDIDLANGHLFVSEGRAGFTVIRGCQFFYDGFESGDVSAWSEADQGR